MNITPIQFKADEPEPVRLEKMRRLAEQLATVARALDSLAGVTGPITVGAADSAGPGFRLLRVPN